MRGDPFADYSYEELAHLYEQYRDENPEIANMIMYGMQSKMQKAGVRNHVGNRLHEEIKIDELLETKRCVHSTLQQSVQTLVGVLVCLLIFRVFKYTFFRVLPSSLRNLTVSAFGAACLYIFYQREDIMLISPLLALFATLKFILPQTKTEEKPVEKPEEII